MGEHRHKRASCPNGTRAKSLRKGNRRDEHERKGARPLEPWHDEGMEAIGRGGLAIAGIFVAHLLFRTFYAGVNVPYLAMTARISADPGDRAFVAGTRMMFGTAASVLVALTTVPVGRWLMGAGAARAYF